MSKPKRVRCRGCGQAIHESDTNVVRVSTGQLRSLDEHGLEDFREMSDSPVWGYMHRRCFLSAVGDPEAITMLATG